MYDVLVTYLYHVRRTIQQEVELSLQRQFYVSGEVLR